MKQLLFALVLIGGLAACTKHNQKGTVTRDCTGTYLDIGDNHYRVCNSDVLSDIDSDRQISVNFEILNSCTEGDDEIVCFLYHPYDKDIKVTNVK